MDVGPDLDRSVPGVDDDQGAALVGCPVRVEDERPVGDADRSGTRLLGGDDEAPSVLGELR
jgi:hypothetical protein